MQTTSSSPTECSRETNGNQKDSNALAPSWSPRIVYIRADITGLASPLIPFAIFKSNPLPGFHAALPAHLGGASEEIELLWNRPFEALAQGQEYFLVAWSAVPRISARVVAAAELALGVATPGPYYKRWITTCTVSFRGEPVAWCIEVDMLGDQEEVIEIILNEGNMRHLSPSLHHATNA
jgi:hypothetical protein